MIRVAVTDPAARVRTALRMRLQLEADVDVVAECASVECALRVVGSGDVDVLVVDLVGDDLDQTSTALLDGQVPCGVVVLSLDDRLARLAGARVRFVSKYADESAVVDAVRHVHALRVPAPHAVPAPLPPPPPEVARLRRKT